GRARPRPPRPPDGGRRRHRRTRPRAGARGQPVRPRHAPSPAPPVTDTDPRSIPGHRADPDPTTPHPDRPVLGPTQTQRAPPRLLFLAADPTQHVSSRPP